MTKPNITQTFSLSRQSPIQHIDSYFSLPSSVNSLQKLKLHLSIQMSIIRSSPLLKTYYAHAPSQGQALWEEGLIIFSLCKNQLYIFKSLNFSVSTRLMRSDSLIKKTFAKILKIMSIEGQSIIIPTYNRRNAKIIHIFYKLPDECTSTKL